MPFTRETQTGNCFLAQQIRDFVIPRHSQTQQIRRFLIPLRGGKQTLLRDFGRDGADVGPPDVQASGRSSQDKSIIVYKLIIFCRSKKQFRFINH